ncbi:hypothetical protein IRJ41_008925 [Triplophysa rosa]|uniref:Uncharacterized protein n=1 Tax=Triplophysa rosa TaxID=992332 RepID=A0A9W7WH23_TRIRA|nr:hypothetical protein IRJ41_008925 [Triplophysa rosa]
MASGVRWAGTQRDGYIYTATHTCMYDPVDLTAAHIHTHTAVMFASRGRSRSPKHMHGLMEGVAALDRRPVQNHRDQNDAQRRDPAAHETPVGCELSLATPSAVRAVRVPKCRPEKFFLLSRDPSPYGYPEDEGDLKHRSKDRTQTRDSPEHLQ